MPKYKQPDLDPEDELSAEEAQALLNEQDDQESPEMRAVTLEAAKSGQPWAIKKLALPPGTQGPEYRPELLNPPPGYEVGREGKLQPKGLKNIGFETDPETGEPTHPAGITTVPYPKDWGDRTGWRASEGWKDKVFNWARSFDPTAPEGGPVRQSTQQPAPLDDFSAAMNPNFKGTKEIPLRTGPGTIKQLQPNGEPPEEPDVQSKTPEPTPPVQTPAPAPAPAPLAPSAPTEAPDSAPPEAPERPKDRSSYYAALKDSESALDPFYKMIGADFSKSHDYLDSKMAQEAAQQKEWRDKTLAEVKGRFSGRRASDEGVANRFREKQIKEFNLTQPQERTVNALMDLEKRLSSAEPIKGWSANAWSAASSVPIVGGFAEAMGNADRSGTEAESVMRKLRIVMRQLAKESSGLTVTDNEVEDYMKQLGAAAGQSEAAFREGVRDVIRDVRQKAKRTFNALPKDAQDEISRRGIRVGLGEPMTIPIEERHYKQEGVPALGTMLNKAVGVGENKAESDSDRVNKLFEAFKRLILEKGL